jgi:hypothetical protein
MDTAKVEVRKLQLLCDRVNQCIDALNQVRFSVYGLEHSTGVNPGYTVPGFLGVPQQNIGFGYGVTNVPGIGHTTGYATNPWFNTPINAPLGALWANTTPWANIGLNHTSYLPAPVNPFFASQNLWNQNPFTGIGVGGIGGISHTNYAGYTGGYLPTQINPWFANQSMNPWTNLPVGGISHTTDINQNLWRDPYYATRLAQTFPFAFSAYPQVPAIY